MNYIIFKFYSKLISFLYTKKTGLPLVRKRGQPNILSKKILFDFSHFTTHLGDRLFFLPLLYHLNAQGYQIYLSKNDRISKNFLNKVCIQKIHFLEMDSIGYSEVIVVVPNPSVSDIYKKYRNSFYIDFNDNFCNKKIAEQLLESISTILKIQTQLVKLTTNFEKKSNWLSGTKPQYYLFNNYLDSGRFRKLFLNEKLLLNKANQLRSQGYYIIHIGSLQDKNNDCNKYVFVNLDLRGITDPSDLPGLISDPRVIGVISYDNVLMHLAGLYCKDAWILFRGRFNKKNFQHHIKFVNSCFFENEAHLKYLNHFKF